MTERSTEQCNADVYKYGESCGFMANLTKEEVEAKCQELSRTTPYTYDWHYAAGRIHVKRLAKNWDAPIPDDYQINALAWAQECFGNQKAFNLTERCHRLMEETAELTQSLGYTEEQAIEIIRYVFARQKGEPSQEVGGVVTTLAVLCAAADVKMGLSAVKELERIRDPEVMEKIRQKNLAKPSPQRTT